MYHLKTLFEVNNKTEILPQIFTVGHEAVNSSDYKWTSSMYRPDDYCAFQFTISGEGIFKKNGMEYRVSSGKGFLFNTIDGDWEYYYPDTALAPWEFIYVEFKGKNAWAAERWLTKEHGHIYDLETKDPVIRRLIHFIKNGISRQKVTSALSA